MNEQYRTLKSNVKKLGNVLGHTIETAHGEALLGKVEAIRQLSKAARGGDQSARTQLIDELQNLPDDQLLPVTHAFSQFLNLANIAEQYHTISREHQAKHPQSQPLENLFARLKEQDVDPSTTLHALEQLHIDIVLTAHPTEIARRTTIHKLVEMNDCLSQLELSELSDEERAKADSRLEQLIAQAWHSDVIRKQRPTPVDEAKWGLAVVENSLWEAVPQFLRRLDRQLHKHLQQGLTLEMSPITFSSWMGGDRDGNPFVTAKVTQEVLTLSRCKAAELYLQDIQNLITELSMIQCNDELRTLVGDAHEPYRAVLKPLRQQLVQTIHALEQKLADPQSHIEPSITEFDQLWSPLKACYHSLMECGMSLIANGVLLDVLRRLQCFGLHLVRLDVRQESTRHSDAIAEITRYLGLGDYSQWSETDKIAFLVRELASKRPLLPKRWTPSEETKELLETCKVIGQHDAKAFGAYVISMAHTASDVLAVHLLLQESGCDFKMDVCPLFETLDDLNHAESVIQQLLSIDWYRGYIKNHQMVMIGYSDSAKDAGVLAAGWAQYRAMDALVKVCEEANVELTLFHGRGGSVGRGGAPAHAALLSQPPRSLKGGLRVTEQGEMIRFKLGLPDVAINSLMLYSSAILEANLLPPPEPKAEWRQLMDTLSELSCQAYRNVVRGNENFVPYFRAATPEQELSKLPLGSRPAKRNPTGGVESLRAIPWIFAWSQNRLLLPAWLGAGEAIQFAIDQGQRTLLEEMCREWPFFSTRLGMLEMVYTKTNLGIAEYYDQRLTDPSLWSLGETLRTQLQKDIQTVLNVENLDHLMAQDPWGAQAIKLRNVYVEPLNMLQAELLYRTRQSENPSPLLEEALMVTIAGIATGMRNTG